MKTNNRARENEFLEVDNETMESLFSDYNESNTADKNENNTAAESSKAAKQQSSKATESSKAESSKAENDNVNHPKHYQGSHECIDVMRALFGDEAVKAFCKCNSFKYRFRAAEKNGIEDIKKAEWYEEYLMKMEREKGKHK